MDRFDCFICDRNFNVNSGIVRRKVKDGLFVHCYACDHYFVEWFLKATNSSIYKFPEKLFSYTIAETTQFVKEYVSSRFDVSDDEKKRAEKLKKESNNKINIKSGALVASTPNISPLTAVTTWATKGLLPVSIFSML